MNLEPVNISRHGFSILQIETKSTCNMQCKFCAYPYRPDKGKTLSEKSIFDIIDSLEVTDNRFKYICFSHFNEPLLDDRIYTFIPYAKRKNLPVMIITNGLLFCSSDVIYKLIDSSPDFIKISLQTANAALFQSSRGINSSFQEYKNGIFEFLRAALGKASMLTIDVACNFLSGPRNIKTIIFGLERGDPSAYHKIDDLRSDIKVFLNELKNTDKRFCFDVDGVDSYLDEADIYYSNEKAGFNISENITFKIKPFIYGKRLTEFYPAKDGIGCQNEILGILASGNVVPCCLAYGDMLSMGNVQEEPLKMILEQNIHWHNNIRKGIGLPLCCQRCLGAPTRRGVLFRQLKDVIINKTNYQWRI